VDSRVVFGYNVIFLKRWGRSEVKVFMLLVLIVFWLGAGEVKLKRWEKGDTLLSYFEKKGVPGKLYYNLSIQDKELASEIRAGMPFYEMEQNGSLYQALIPINEELQIHIFKKGGYKLEFIPIHYIKVTDRLSLALQNSPYIDILKASNHNVRLASEFVSAFKHSIDFSHSIHKGDKLALIYEQKLRLGRLFGMPTIKAAVVETKKKPHYIFNFHDRYYDEQGKELESFLLKRPIPHARITSRFTLRRWHPVLHRYRAHLGVDFGARRGTPIKAAGNGRVVFAGRKGGYGNVIIIAHRGGYKTLYAHMSKFRRGIRYGKRVKQGQVIGYVGSTGLSTGPHLHFGLYKNGRPINPLRVVHIAKSRLYGKRLKEFRYYVKKYKKKLNSLIKEEILPTIQAKEFNNISYAGGDNGKKGAS